MTCGLFAAQKPTFVCLNLVLLMCVFAIVGSLLLAVNTHPLLVPHLAFLLILAFGLWALIIWYVRILGNLLCLVQFS